MIARVLWALVENDTGLFKIQTVYTHGLRTSTHTYANTTRKVSIWTRIRLVYHAYEKYGRCYNAIMVVDVSTLQCGSYG